jgi:ankyrin repeat protein
MAGDNGLGFPEMSFAGGLGEETVWDAASNGDVELLQHLLAEGADPNQADEEGRTGLHFSCGYGELGCAEALLDRGADPNLQDHNQNTPLHYSAGYGQAGAVKLLCAR